MKFSVLAVMTFVGTFLLIEETLPTKQRKPFQWAALGKDYVRLLTNFDFMVYSTISISAFTAIVIYVSNLSVIFVNHMDMDLSTFSYWQATTMATFIVFALLSTKIIGVKGLDYARHLGASLALFGPIALFFVSYLIPQNAPMICLSMAFVAAGGALFAAPFGLKAMSVFPEMKGFAGAMLTAIRQSFAAGLVALSEVMFDGSITPIATIIFGISIVCTIFMVCRRCGLR